MPLPKRRYQKTRSFRGESLGARVVDFLNADSDLHGKKRVLSVLADAREIVNNARRTSDGLFEIRDSDQFQRAKERLNNKIGRYKVVFGFAFHSDGRWSFAELFRGSRQHSLGEFQAVHALVSLAKDGLLERVRQCEYCHAWFFALFSHQRCCGAPRDCRIKLHHSSEEYKRQKREYAREAYARKKDQERRWLEQPRKGKRG